ncbi:MAG: molybdopterin-synthase adenylyltransferase MoeB [Gammaproteobacteria bacterium]|nr:molybdopterin-synthase adenylyltransferase MoeB [Gammaproteobacteria bacterium]
MEDHELLRYSRQIMLPEIDISGQEKLLQSSVLVVGMGGLGCPIVMYLAAAGVGHLILADFDAVDLTNLQRQIAHGTADIGRQKVESAYQTIMNLNPGTSVSLINERLEGDALLAQAESADVVVDATDNFTTRFAINAACVKTRTPLVSGAAVQLEGQVIVINPEDSESPCYRCLYNEADDAQFSCAENGVLAPVVGMIGTVQAMETIKLLVGFGEILSGYLLVLDAKNMEWRKLRLPKNEECPVCGGGR